ncbi:hypothetical protein Tco_0535274 [Tanacetum coccineum]
MDPVTLCITLPSHLRSLKRLLFHFSRRLHAFLIGLSSLRLVDITNGGLSAPAFRSTKIQKYTIEFYTSAGNPVKEILLKLNLPDHRKLKDGGEVKEFQRSFRHSDTERLSQSDEVLKLKNFKKDATLKLFKSTNQERYDHVWSRSTSSHDRKLQ